MGQRSVSREAVPSFSMGTDYVSPAIDVTQARSIYIQVPVTLASSLSGTLSIEASADQINWLQLGTLAVSVSTNGVNAFDISTTGAPFMRVKWVRTTGSATGSVTYSIKLEG